MKYINQILMASILLAPALGMAVGGQAQKDMLCGENEFRGVGRVYAIRADDKGQIVDMEKSTMQVLPLSNRKLCITAKHCIKDESYRTRVTLGMFSAWAKRTFLHPDLDVAIIELAESIPSLEESDLPALPQKSKKRRSSRRSSLEEQKTKGGKSEIWAKMVGFGITSSDDLHPGLLSDDNGQIKNKGDVTIILRGSKYVSEWKLSPDERQVYAAPGDSGGPLILEQTLIGITTSHQVSYDWIYKDFTPLTKKQHMRLVDANRKPLLKFQCNDDEVYVYDAEHDDTIKIYKEGTTHSYEEILELITEASGLYKCSEVPPFRSIVNRVLHLSRDETRIVHTSYFVDITQCMEWIEGIYTECGLDLSSK